MDIFVYYDCCICYWVYFPIAPLSGRITFIIYVQKASFVVNRFKNFFAMKSIKKIKSDV